MAVPHHLTPPTDATRNRMRAARRRDTKPELLLRRRLHSRGLRFFVEAAVVSGTRRRADVVFPRRRVAVFVDGCFWHGCPQHWTLPRTNAEFWRAKISANVVRDLDTNQRLESDGWMVIRVWEHEDPDLAADLVERAVRSR